MAQQVGGDHYKGSYQHWDWMVDVNLGPLEAAATKYIPRWYKKNGIQDLEKVISYVEKIRECYMENRLRNASKHVSMYSDPTHRAMQSFSKFEAESNVPLVESHLCLMIAQWRNQNDLDKIIAFLKSHTEAARQRFVANGTHGPLMQLGGTNGAKTGGSGAASGPTG